MIDAEVPEQIEARSGTTAHRQYKWFYVAGVAISWASSAVQRGRRVNSLSLAPQLRVTERHSAADFGSSG